MKDKEWAEYCAWWLKQYPLYRPDRSSVEQYLEWKKEKRKKK